MAAITSRDRGGFEILERLGGGGMAEVLLGRARGGTETGFVKLVAIKRIHPWMAKDRSFIEMLLDEARIAANLSHINIAQTYDLRRSGETYFIIMEYIHGVNLTRLKSFFSERSTPAPAPMIAFLLANICAGLEYAHNLCDQRGRPMRFIHRDVSPDNVMVSFEGEVKLIDFGIARAAARFHKTEGGQVKGKPVYMSPEQACGEPVDCRTDIYSAGLVLYELLTLQNPLRGEGSMDSMRRAMEPRIAPPSAIVSGIPKELEQICVKALAVDPEHRYPSAGAMEQELYGYLRVHPYSRQQLASWVKENLAEERARLQEVLSGLKTPVGLREEDLPVTEPVSSESSSEPVDPAVFAKDAVTLLDPSGEAPVLAATEQYYGGAEHRAMTLVGAKREAPGLPPTEVYQGGAEHRAQTLVGPEREAPGLPPTELYHGGAEHFVPTLELQAEPAFEASSSKARQKRRKRILLLLLAVGGVALFALATVLFMLISRPEPLGTPGAAVEAKDSGAKTTPERR